MSVQEYKQHLFEAIQNMLWRHWSALGLPGHIHVSESESILDPESLLLFSSIFARYDQRLYDLILDWIQTHSSQINIQRLKTLYSKVECKDTASLGYIASIAAETDPARWRKPSHDYALLDASTPLTLFRKSDNTPEDFIPKFDFLARQYGFLRNPRKKTGKITSRSPQNTASLLLRMRGILGVSARAETILILLTSNICKIQNIVERSGFCWKSIQEVLEELIASNFVSSINGISKGKQYYLSNPDKILLFFDIHTPIFAAWPNIYDAIGLLWQCCSNHSLADVSEETFQNELKTLYLEKIQPKIITSYHPALQQTTMDLLHFPKFIDAL